jgi:hypothetical protein
MGRTGRGERSDAGASGTISSEISSGPQHSHQQPTAAGRDGPAYRCGLTWWSNSLSSCVSAFSEAHDARKVMRLSSSLALLRATPVAAVRGGMSNVMSKANSPKLSMRR